MAKEYKTRSHDAPGEYQPDVVDRLRVAPPEIYRRMHHKPIKRNGELQEKDERGDPAKRLHRRILVEAAGGRKHLSGSRRLRNGRSMPLEGTGEAAGIARNFLSRARPAIDAVTISLEDSWFAL